ncbi:hybrid sensor histidine kinase/response regulator transcription factor [Ulvibacterium sp.]|uniref:hybrid sensor histidine kinase/response regulator transcription factor n=1 Tax=Ulvibacterium sp. TaxID=2665914 RepID=UPI003BAC5C19
MYRLCFAFLVSFVFGALVAQRTQVNYTDHLSIAEGLGHNGVTDIYQDSRGFIWIATFDGLNRYDGYKVKVFKNTVDRQLFASNRIRSLAEVTLGSLLIGTDEGLTVYNFKTKDFKNVYSNKNDGIGNKGPIIRDIFKDENRNLIVCVTEREGILLFDQNLKLIDKFTPKGNFGRLPLFFNSGIQAGPDEYLFATSSGIIIFSVGDEQFHPLFLNQGTSSRAIAKLGGHRFISVGQQGAFLFEYQEGTADKIEAKTIKGLESLSCNTVGLDVLGNVWVGTAAHGFYTISKKQLQSSSVVATATNFGNVVGTLRSSCITATADHGTWIGTFNKGLFHLPKQENAFRGRVEIDHPNTSSHEISQVSVLDEHRIYMAFNRGGLTLLNTTTNEFETPPLRLTQEELHQVSTVLVDSNKNVWLKMQGENNLFRVKKGSDILYTPLNNLSLQSIVRNSPITEDKQGNIWVGAYGNLYKIIVDGNGAVIGTDSLSTNPMFLNNTLSRVRSLYIDANEKYIWVGTSADGLFRINIDNELPLHKKPIKQYLKDDKNDMSISSNFVSTILRLDNGDLWIGTERGGICKMVADGNTPKFVTYSEKDGLSNNVVKNIVPDENGNLWISTNNGLNVFYPDTSEFRTFDKEDGLPFQDFSYASARLGNGSIFMAGESGFTHFNPKNIPANESLPKLQWDDLRIYNERIAPGDTLNNRVVLNQPLSEQGSVDLKYNENVFSIEALSLHYSSESNHFLRYRLDPLNKDWVTVPSNQYLISYSGLSPGQYSLQVEASNSMNQWTSPLELDITINPPWWKTNWAYLLYFLFLGLLVFVVVKVILNMQSLHHKLEIEELEMKNVKEVNAAKLRFFTNISHEIKTPLTLITGPVNMLVDRFKGNPDLNGKLRLVKRQANKILQLIDQVQDFQKADAHSLKMNYTRFHFNDFVKNMVQDFEYKAETDKKHFVIEDGGSEIYISADKDKLEKIFNNLLNNAFKFTKTGDTISFKFRSEEKDLFVEVIDTGIGIPQEDLPFIFDRFFQSSSEDSYHSTGSGIGLAFSKHLAEMHYGEIGVTSEHGNGSTFYVRLPVVKEQSAIDQEKQEKDIIKAEEKSVNHGIQIDDLVDEFDVSKITHNGEYSHTLVYYVEDIPDMRKYVSGILSNFFDVKTFKNGQECLDAMEVKWPEIIISDLLMPEVNGLELCKRVKADIKTSHIPFVLLTACTTIEDQIQGIKDGADAYIRKPFNVQHLISKTEALLHNRKQLRERFEIGLPITWEKNNNNRNDNAFIERLYGLMAKNMDNQDLDLDSFARELYLNRTHFYQKVKALTNHTPYELLKQYRLKKAAELLASNDYSVNEVYTMTGFKSRTHFSKLFKQTYSVTPSKYTKTVESSLVNGPE